ncbi:PIG-L family deacetylase [Thermomonospora catenispora]|uniref:PIG-L family deacetylase n=1 Tax=Thermomonospora catenispora TaxID=2493090 RepID=UPI00111DCA87|nr:PIG-L family deacetylase [Thermomonospora catenispora]TNY37809.1 hypothetical protein EIO00_06550 [Thermomonospora catenispora]
MGLMCVHAHPDDEAIWTGGVLARAADEGIRTAVVTCTWTEGTRRAAELARSLEILGAGRPRLLGYADAEVPESGPSRFVDAPLEESVGRLVAHIRDFRPDTVITYDAYGGYGHPDHIHAHRVTLAAVEAAAHPRLHPEAGDPWRVRELHLVTFPLSVVRTLWEELLGAPPEPDRALPGVPDEMVALTVDVRPWTGRKWRALQAHESEAERGAGPAMLSGLSEEQRVRLLGTEYYIRRPLTGDPAPG